VLLQFGQELSGTLKIPLMRLFCDNRDLTLQHVMFEKLQLSDDRRPFQVPVSASVCVDN
jgi:hypothetical protein